MNKILICILFLIFGSLSSYSQIKKEYNFAGEYNKATAQGMAIYKNSAFLFNNGGYCRIYDLKKTQLVSEFNLNTADKDNHVNCAKFGIEFPKGNKKYPALYISECTGKSRCFVESIDEKGSKLIQTLQLKIKGTPCGFSWMIDKQQKVIYTIYLTVKNIDSIGTQRYALVKLPLPSLDSTEIVFTENNIIDKFEIEFPNLAQGGSIYKNSLYLPVGLHDFKGGETRKDKTRTIIIVNLKTKQIERTIHIGDIVKEEPEDVDVYKNNLLLYCGQEGGLFKINIK